MAQPMSAAESMHRLYFHELPTNVARDVFRDVINKFVQDNSDTPGAPKPTLDLDVANPITADRKHCGHGYIQFSNEKALEVFLAKLKVEPIVFNSKKVLFSREPSDDLEATGSRPSDDPATGTAAARPQVPDRQEPNANGSTINEPVSARGTPIPRMNLNRSRYPRREKREIPPPNPVYLKRLEHRLSVLGQHMRVERLEFGVLRNNNFSVEYSRSLLEETGWLIFEDDEKSIRITTRGSHQDSIMPSIAIPIQTVDCVALGSDLNNPYMFLALSQNPHFEEEDIARSTTGNARRDARLCRTRHSCLDAAHERVAPFASRWIRVIFHHDSPYPTPNICKKANLPKPEIDPPLTFNKLDMYSLQYVSRVMNWAQGGSLPWDVAFQVEALFRNGTLVPQELLSIQPIIDKMAKENPDRAADVLRTWGGKIQGAGAGRTLNRFVDQDVVGSFTKYIEVASESTSSERLRHGISKSNFMCYHVKITPTAIHLTGPLAEQSNRVIRRYPHFESYFIRVSFTDEADGHTRFEYEVDTQAFTQKRLGQFLKGRLQIGDRFYELLGYSQSAFRDHSCFFSAPFSFDGQDITAQSIRDSLGDFDQVIHCPARYGARMSQAFSSTDPSIVLEESTIKDVRELAISKEAVFSDGCSALSKDLAAQVWEAMLAQMSPTRRKRQFDRVPVPCAFQIRIGGSKGMVRIDPKLEGRVLCLRPSMTKFVAPHDRSLEISRAFTSYSPCFLNRPLVMLLWSGGVDDSVFETLMQGALETTKSDMATFGGVARQLSWNRIGHSFRLADTFKKLHRLGLKLDQPGVRTSGLHKILNAGLCHIKIDLKHKARIKVPDSYTLVGVCDEDRYLKPRQIYACVQEFDHQTREIRTWYLKGRVLITRSPVIHPGDAQIVFAIGEPPVDSPFAGEGNNLPNCVVFSSLGPHPVPNMLGGGDLDGDLYNLIQYRDLIPRHIYTPAKYPSPKLKEIEAKSTIEDVADFMVDYVCNDALGMIATNHLLIASRAELRARDDNCIENAKLHSIAVDFVKTGVPVPHHKIRRKPADNTSANSCFNERTRPDWQAGHGRDPTDGHHYECPSVLGKLFRAVEIPGGNPARQSDIIEQVPTSIRKCIASYVARYGQEIQEAMGKCDTQIKALLLRYNAELNYICASHTISSESSERVSEVEVMLGTNLEVSSKSDLIERMKRLTGELADFVRSELKGGEEDSLYDRLARSWRAYLLTSSLGDETFGALSFSWLALDLVLETLRDLDENFLPPGDLALPPFSSIPSAGREAMTEEDVSGEDMENWNWVDLVEEGETPTSENSSTDNRPTNRSRNSRNSNGGNRPRGYRILPGSNSGHSDSNGGMNGNGDENQNEGDSPNRDSGGPRRSSSTDTDPQSSNGRNAGNGPGNNISNSNRRRGRGARRPGRGRGTVLVGQ